MTWKGSFVDQKEKIRLMAYTFPLWKNVVTNIIHCFHQRTDVHTCLGRRDSSDLGPFEDVIFVRSCGDIGRSEIALVEGADLVRLESADDGVQESSIVEEDEVVLLPIVRIHKLFDNMSGGTSFLQDRHRERTCGAMAGRCIL